MSDRHAYAPVRAEKAAAAMEAVGYSSEYPRDIISDAMHYAASIGLDPLAEVEAARRHYDAESHDTGDGMNEDGDPIAYGEVTP